jgi:1,4-alpha-glucan branching enzyme
MIPLGSNGLWEVFIPDVGAGLKYKFAIQGRDGRWVDHADPLAREAELPPSTVTTNLGAHLFLFTKFISALGDQALITES